MKYLILLLTLSSLSMGNGVQMIEDVLNRLNESAPYTLLNIDSTADYTFKQIKWNDKSTPLSISLLGNTDNIYTDKMVFLLAAGNAGLEFETNAVETMSHAYRKAGYLVISITPRIDNVTSVIKKLRRWGVDKLVKDAHKVIWRATEVVSLDYTVFGFSYGALPAFLIAAMFPHESFEELHVLGFDSYDPVNDPELITFAQGAFNNAIDSIDAGVYVDYSVAGLKDFVAYVAAFPNDPSEFPGFTNEELLNYVLTTPDPQSDLALQQNAAGNAFGLDHFSLETLAEGAAKFGTGYIPWALVRDFYGATSFNECYSIDFERITAKVIYVNSELGYGDLTYWSTLVDDSEVYVIQDYGHLGLVLGDSARVDVFSKFLD